MAAYSKPDVKEQMHGLDAKQALQCLTEGPTTFCLEMAFKVGAEKMATAIAEAGNKYKVLSTFKMFVVRVGRLMHSVV